MVNCPSTPFSIKKKKKSITNGVKLGLQVVRTLVNTSPGVCVFLYLTFRNYTVPSPQGNGLCRPSPPLSQQLLLNSVDRAGLHRFLPGASHSPHLESRAQRLWGKLGEICWDWPEETLFTHTNGSCPRACFLLPSLSSSGREGQCSSLWCLKQVYFSFSTLAITSLHTTVAFLNLLIFSCCVCCWFQSDYHQGHVGKYF